MRSTVASWAALEAVASFEPLFFNNLAVVLDGFFVHRSRTLEGKDRNPLNEFRMICTSLLQNHGVMCTDKTNNKTIKYSPEKSVAQLKSDDEIKLTESSFVAPQLITPAPYGSLCSQSFYFSKERFEEVCSDWRIEKGGFHYPHQWDVFFNERPYELRTITIDLCINNAII